MEDSPIMTLEEVAAFLKVSEQTVYELARSGNLPGRKVGREWRFFKPALINWFMQGVESGEGKVQRDEFGGEYKVENGEEKIALWLPMSLAEKEAQIAKAAAENINISEIVAEFLREWLKK